MAPLSRQIIAQTEQKIFARKVGLGRALAASAAQMMRVAIRQVASGAQFAWT
jgi:hypothetical protein